MLTLGKFYLRDKLTSTGLNVSISDLQSFNGGSTSPASFTNETVILVNYDGSIREITQASASGGILTFASLSSRGLDNSSTKTSVSANRLERRAGTQCYITASASDIPDLDGNNTFTGNQTITNGDIIFTGSNSAGIRLKSLTTAQRNALTPYEGNSILNTTTFTIDTFINGAWVPSSILVDASATQKGVVEISTQTETEDQTTTGGSGPLVPTNVTINPNNITSTAPATGDKISFADISNSNKLRSTTLQTAVDTARPLATNAEAQTGTGTTQAITPYQLKNFAGPVPTAGTVNYAFPTVSSMTTTFLGYTKKSEATVTRDGTYRITFTGSSNSGFRYIRIYKNGMPFGTERGGTGAGTTFSEDLTFAAGDLLQLYMKNDSGATSTCSNYSVQYNAYIMTNTTY